MLLPDGRDQAWSQAGTEEFALPTRVRSQYLFQHSSELAEFWGLGREGPRHRLLYTFTNTCYLCHRGICIAGLAVCTVSKTLTGYYVP